MVDDAYSVEPVKKICMKLKYPKDEGFPKRKDPTIMKNDMVRVCEVCNKVFSSGKALGGHMRIHFQQAKYKDLLISRKKLKFKKQNSHSRDIQVSSEELKSNLDFDDHMKADKPVCAICGRDFPSMKSLFGHLRCHPDRGWRGLQPPQLGNEDRTSTFSSSSSLLDAELSSEIGDHEEINDFDCADDKESVHLPESLSGGWTVTGRRGRKATMVGSTSEDSSSEEGELVYNAACDLMMLSCDLITRNEKKVEAAKTKNLDMDSVSKCKSKRKIDEVVENNVVIYNEELESGGKNRKKNRKKVIKLCDLDRMDDTVSTPSNHKVGAAAGEKYRCNTCDKSFPTYQALGGHMSSHNKIVKVVYQNSMDVKRRMQVEEMDTPEKNVNRRVYLSAGDMLNHVVPPSETFTRGLDFDLNKLPSDDEVAS